MRKTIKEESDDVSDEESRNKKVLPRNCSNEWLGAVVDSSEILWNKLRNSSRNDSRDVGRSGWQAVGAYMMQKWWMMYALLKRWWIYVDDEK